MIDVTNVLHKFEVGPTPGSPSGLALVGLLLEGMGLVRQVLVLFGEPIVAAGNILQVMSVLMDHGLDQIQRALVPVEPKGYEIDPLVVPAVELLPRALEQPEPGLALHVAALAPLGSAPVERELCSPPVHREHQYCRNSTAA